MSRVMHTIFLSIIILSLFIWGGCGSGRQTVKDGQGSSVEQSSQDDYDEIERLLGINRDESQGQQSKEEQTDETGSTNKNDDLLRLLEVDEGKRKASDTDQSLASEDKRVNRLQTEVQDLKKELKKKDLEIADLRAQLMLKEDELKSKSGGTPTSSNRFYGRSEKSGSTYNQGGLSSDEYVNKYQRGYSLFHEMRYRDALEVFEQLVGENTTHNYSDNAQYWLGESYYAMGRYKEAILAFEKVFTFRYSNKNDYAQFKIGQCYFKLGNKKRATQEFQQLIDNYPKSELISRARQYLSQL